MKVALCISGELRSYQKTFQELKNNIIDKLNPDIFIYSWNDVGGTWKARAQDNKYNGFFVDDFNRYDKLEKNVEKLYSPRKIVLEEFKESYKDKIKNVSRPHELIRNTDKNRWSKYNLPMFYTMYECNKLKSEAEKEDGKKYDLVIKARTDVRFPEIPKNIINKLDVLWYYPKDHNEAHIVSDKFAFSNSDIMDYYCDVFPRLNTYWSEGMYNSLGIWKIGEEMMWHHFYDKSDIKVCSFGDEYYDSQKAQKDLIELKQ